MSSTSLSLCGQKGEWAFTNWVSIKDVQHFQKHKKEEGKESNENKTCTKKLESKAARSRTAATEWVAKCPTVRERESKACFASLRGEPSYARRARGEFSRQAAAAANGRVAELQQKRSRDNESLVRPMTINRVRFVYVSWRVCGSQTRQLNNQTE